MHKSSMDPVLDSAKRGHVQEIVDGPVRYVQRFNSCSNKTCFRCLDDNTGKRIPRHGPYWYLIAYCPARRKEFMIYIGKTLDTRRWRLDDGAVDWLAWFTAKARGKFPNTPATLPADPRGRGAFEGPPPNATLENPAPSAPLETQNESDITP